MVEWVGVRPASLKMLQRNIKAIKSGEGVKKSARRMGWICPALLSFSLAEAPGKRGGN
jgi:hypothetical protein